MTSLILMLIVRADQSDAVIERYARAMHMMPTFEVQVTWKQATRPDIVGDLVMDRKKQLCYHATAPQIDYKLSISPGGYREVDRVARMYDEHPYDGTSQVYKSRISQVIETLPSWFNLPSLRNMVPPKTKFTYVRKENFAGHMCDHIQAQYKSPMAIGSLDCDVAADGLVYGLLRISNTPQGIIHEQWQFANYRPAKTFLASRFSNPIPDGSVPFALNESPGPSEVGSRPSLVGFVDPKSGRSWVAPTGKPLLLLVAGHDSLPSEKAVIRVSQWKEAFKQNGVNLAIISDASTASTSKGLLFDPHQNTVLNLSSPATPTFFLLDTKGKITNIWMGFDSSQATKLRQDVLQAITSLKK